MPRRVVFFVYVSFVLCDPEYVTWKLCKDVDISRCTVQNVAVDPCPRGPLSCDLRMYGIILDMTPHFSAHRLSISITADVEYSGGSGTAMSPGDACGQQFCPLEAELQGTFNIDLTMHQRDCGKFPIKVKIWNENDETEACCVTFNVKSLL